MPELKIFFIFKIRKEFFRILNEQSRTAFTPDIPAPRRKANFIFVRRNPSGLLSYEQVSVNSLNH